MKRFLPAIILLLTAVMSSQARQLTFRQLSEQEGSGVTMRAEGVFVTVGTVSVAEGDTLTLDGVDSVIMRARSLLTIAGVADFRPQQGAVFAPASETAVAQGVAIDGANARGSFTNVTFGGVPLAIKTRQSTFVENCAFVNTREAVGLKFYYASAGNIVRGCTFTETGRSAIQARSRLNTATMKMDTVYVGIIFENNTVTRCNTSGYYGYSMVDLAPGRDNEVIIRNNVITGFGPDKGNVPAITVFNLSSRVEAPHRITITGNRVQNCTGGIILDGRMDADIADNRLLDNRWSATVFSTPWYSGITGFGCGIMLTSGSGLLKARVSRNIVDGHLWGAVAAGIVEANFGRIGAEDPCEGYNVFSRNGTLLADTIIRCDPGATWDYEQFPRDMLASSNDGRVVYAQNCQWGCDCTDEQAIARRVEGNVVFTPAVTAVGTVGADSDGEPLYFTLSGICLGRTLPTAKGVYIRLQGSKSTKIIIN